MCLAIVSFGNVQFSTVILSGEWRKCVRYTFMNAVDVMMLRRMRCGKREGDLGIEGKILLRWILKKFVL